MIESRPSAMQVVAIVLLALLPLATTANKSRDDGRDWYETTRSQRKWKSTSRSRSDWNTWGGGGGGRDYDDDDADDDKWGDDYDDDYDDDNDGIRICIGQNRIDCIKDDDCRWDRDNKECFRDFGGGEGWSSSKSSKSSSSGGMWGSKSSKSSSSKSSKSSKKGWKGGYMGGGGGSGRCDINFEKKCNKEPGCAWVGGECRGGGGGGYDECDDLKKSKCKDKKVCEWNSNKDQCDSKNKKRGGVSSQVERVGNGVMHVQSASSAAAVVSGRDAVGISVVLGYAVVVTMMWYH